MNSNDPSTVRPAPKPPATGADAWKNTPTNCWPTPANMAKAREQAARLDPAYGHADKPSHRAADRAPEADVEAAEESAWESEGGADDSDEPGPATIGASDTDDQPRSESADARASVADAPDTPARFRDSLQRLDDVPARPVADHAETYDAVHRDLRQALDDVDESR